MKTLFKRFFSRHGDKDATLSGFFRGASTQEKKQVIEEIIQKSNKDQRELVEKYNQLSRI